MTSKKLTIAIALLMGLSTASFADNKNEPKEAAIEITNEAPVETTSGVEEQWFHFNGVSGEEGDATKYSQEASPECPSQTVNLRCDIKAYNQASAPTLPNLSTISVERNRDN
jgi:hypothetical protein